MRFDGRHNSFYLIAELGDASQGFGLPVSIALGRTPGAATLVSCARACCRCDDWPATARRCHAVGGG